MIYLPKTIKVGYQNRSGTYTGKLAYVIYYDEKGKLRKEASWNGWRDRTIEPDEFDNVPMDGFVLNKKVGDYKSGWDFRSAYCRVYDPRGFEFEITIENLLYILENVTSIKGKGLDGKFVYGWDGKELLLVPVDSPDYAEIKNLSTKSETPLKTNDYIVGYTYRTTEGNEYVYLGRGYHYTYTYETVPARQTRYYWEQESDTRFANNKITKSSQKYFWFGKVCTNCAGEKYVEICCKSSCPKSIIECADNHQSSWYQQMHDELIRCIEYSPIDFDTCGMGLATAEEIAKMDDDYAFGAEYKDGSVLTRDYIGNCTYDVFRNGVKIGTYTDLYRQNSTLGELISDFGLMIYRIVLENGQNGGFMLKKRTFKNGSFWAVEPWDIYNRVFTYGSIK